MSKKNHEIPEEFREPIVVEDELDLHGFFPEQISEILTEYLPFAQEKNYREVRIIHGKGKSKLKHAVIRFLKKSPLVESFHDAPPELGHWGATIVVLK